METSFSKSPWKYDRDSNTIQSLSGTTVCAMPVFKHSSEVEMFAHPVFGEVVANTLLICSAPELLECLENLAVEVEYYQSTGAIPVSRHIEKIRNLISVLK